MSVDASSLYRRHHLTIILKIYSFCLINWNMMRGKWANISKYICTNSELSGFVETKALFGWWVIDISSLITQKSLLKTRHLITHFIIWKFPTYTQCCLALKHSWVFWKLKNLNFLWDPRTDLVQWKQIAWPNSWDVAGIRIIHHLIKRVCWWLCG